MEKKEQQKKRINYGKRKTTFSGNDLVLVEGESTTSSITRTRKHRKRKHDTRKSVSIALYITGTICIVLGLIDIIPDAFQFGLEDLWVLILFMFIVNIRAFALLTVGLVLILAGSLIKESR